MTKHIKMGGIAYLVKRMKKSNWHGGKGSTPRINTHSKQYQDNWDLIFNKDIKDKDVNSTKISKQKTQQKT